MLENKWTRIEKIVYVKDVSELGQKIRNIRFERNVSQCELSDASGISQNHVSKIENWIRSVTVSTFLRIGRAIYSLTWIRIVLDTRIDYEPEEYIE